MWNIKCLSLGLSSDELYTDFVYVGFPKKTFQGASSFSLNQDNISLASSSFVCPRCYTRYEVHVCIEYMLPYTSYAYNPQSKPYNWIVNVNVMISERAIYQLIVKYAVFSWIPQLISPDRIIICFPFQTTSNMKIVYKWMVIVWINRQRRITAAQDAWCYLRREMWRCNVHRVASYSVSIAIFSFTNLCTTVLDANCSPDLCDLISKAVSRTRHPFEIISEIKMTSIWTLLSNPKIFILDQISLT